MKSFLKVLSLLLVCIVCFGCLQGIAFAAESIQISIPTLSEGVVFEEGAHIPLKVSHNSDLTTISYVDFFANDEKLPGAILSGDESKFLMWYSPAVGEYKVYARIHYIGGGFYDSDKVTVVIRDDSSRSIPTDEMIAMPEIPNGQQNVAYDLPAYRIRFNRPLAHYLTEDKLAGITMYTRYGSVEIDYEIGVDYIDLVPKGHENLEADRTYVVAIPDNTLCDAYGNQVRGQAFTFTTVSNYANRATPIPSVSYPAKDSVISTTGTALAARILFPPENAEDVTFYDNGEEITGTVIKGTDGEFILDDVSLTKGEHSISVSVLKDGKMISSETVTLTATTDSYDVLGVQNGDRIILNSEVEDYTTRVEGYTPFQHKVTIADSDQVSVNMLKQGHLTDSVNFTLTPMATGIDSVVFAIDGNVVSTDSEYPYEFVFGKECAGTHTLTATIHKKSGGTDVKTIAYTGILGETHDARETNYNSGALDESNTPTFNGAVSRGETIVDGALKLSDGNGISAVWLMPGVQTKELELGDSKLFYIDYDIKKSTPMVHFDMRTSREFRALNLSSTNYLQSGFPAGKWAHMTVVADFERGWVSAYMDGVQFKSWSQPPMLASTSNFVTDSFTPQFNGGDIYIDNYAVRTFDKVDVKDYTVSGLEANASLTANEMGYQTNVIIVDSGADSATNLKKAVFKLNNELLATVTEAPFSSKVPLITLGANVLTVETTDANDIIKTVTVPFHVQVKMGGAVAQKLTADSEMPAGKAAVANPGEATSYVLYEAVYNADKTLKNATCKTVDISAGEIKIHTANAVLEEDETVRLFTWTKDLRPLD